MRLGENPAKFGASLPGPAPVTVATVTYIPFQSGYFESSLDVLKLCLASLFANTPQPFDLLVFDNGSCPETINYLTDMAGCGLIQYLVLAEHNVGKLAAWNFMIGAAPGEYLAYADSDVYFHPGWLEEETRVLSAFQNTGMVSGMPAMHGFGLFTDSTLRLAEADPETTVERGQFMPDEWIMEWGQSLGQDPAAFLAHCREIEQVRLTRHGVAAYAVAAHFQFLARLAALRQVLPLPANRPVGAESVLDEKLDSQGFARLSTSRPVVAHLGNTLSTEWQAKAGELGLPTSRAVKSGRTPAGRLLRWRPVRRAILEAYHLASRLVMASSA
jgi:hypothetical protein